MFVVGNGAVPEKFSPAKLITIVKAEPAFNSAGPKSISNIENYIRK